MIDIESLLKEKRVFQPPEGFSRAAHVKSLEEYRRLYDRSVNDPEGFWAEQAQALVWSRKWDRVLDWSPPFAKWFVGGTLNLSENCLDRHVAAGRAGEDRDPVGGRAGRDARPHLRGAPGRGGTVRQRAARSGRGEGRPRRDLHADDPGGRGGHAGLRAHRGHAQRGLRRLLVRGPARPHERRPGAADRHRGRRLPAGRGRSPQGQRGRGARGGRLPVREDRGGRAAHGAGRADARRAATTGGTTGWRRRRRSARPSRSRPSTRSSSSTRAAPPGSRRASCTPPPATCCRRR